ncbi:MAG: ATP-binding cassette domain-containing protein [Bacteroidota bacterium]|nr:ATP-binding cassette domain-containing protein [Bacteroidota bacterium]MXW13594.1 ATP-binding cassette domain-containing protein [Rhodothermaceae bacterium]MDE2645453.1 ATP-binding cassette domain-containing protein [Bacteroidota bacterium]MXW31809.1 ATP-binding cassette domain-containing protein [Rhodothermaceae bacterium]MYC03334.1 ATP-binding cassette domain-containing protein [Rhodothermaceae bacterium]
MNSLVLQGVTKCFGKVTAAQDISFTASSGRILGLLGPNGAGKTTTIRMIANIFTPDEGTVTFGGREVGPWSQEKMGYLPEERGLYKKLKVNDQLRYLAALKGLGSQESTSKVEYWLDRLELTKWGARKAQDLSKGMQQKVQFIATVLADPQLLILDEPFSGLDPVNSALLREIIAEMKQQGRIILFASHRMEQVEQLCDDICLIANGRLVLSGGLREIKKRFKREKLVLEYEGKVPFLDAMQKSGEIQVLELRDDGCVLRISEDCNPRALLDRVLSVPDLALYRFELLQPSMNEIFIQTVGASDES